MTDSRHDNGFTLIELVAVVVVLGIVLVVAAPYMDGGRSLRELDYPQALLADLRFARRRAEADGCEVRVAISATSVSYRQRAALCSGAFNRPVESLDATGALLDAAPPEGVSLASSPPVFYFDAAGRVLDSVGGAAVDVTITAGSRQIDVEGATGYAAF
ncbi:MAG: prepilin-type N-terminal cleavage/methylation domain-containing protein [Woeseiaceae bacterium]